MTTHRPRKRLSERSDLSLGDLERHPDMLVGPADLASVGIVGSYSSIARWVKAKKIPEPIRLPSGRQVWRAGELLDRLGF